MALFLIVDPDEGAIRSIATQLESRQHHVVSWSHQRTLPPRQTRHIDVAIVALDIESALGLNLIARLVDMRPAPRVVAASISGTFHLAARALKHGASMLVTKPYRLDELLDAAMCGSSLGAVEVAHGADRLIRKIVSFCASPSDATSLQSFGRHLGVSRGALRNWCATAGLAPRQVLLLARGLRAVHVRGRDPQRKPADILDLADARSIRKFLVASGGGPNDIPVDVATYCQAQRFVSDKHFVDRLRRAYERSMTLHC